MSNRKVGQVWKQVEGSKVTWRVQFEKGIHTVSSKKLAIKFAETFYGKAEVVK